MGSVLPKGHQEASRAGMQQSKEPSELCSSGEITGALGAVPRVRGEEMGGLLWEVLLCLEACPPLCQGRPGVGGCSLGFLTSVL